MLDLADGPSPPDFRVFARLSPVPLEIPTWLDRDFASAYAQARHHEKLSGLITDADKIRRQVTWDVYLHVIGETPSLSTRMTPRVWETALCEAAIVPGAPQPLRTGPVSLYALLLLNNALCIYYLRRVSLMTRVPVAGPFFLRFGRYRRALQQSVETAAERLAVEQTRRTVGDLFFLHGLMPFVRSLMGDETLARILRRFSGLAHGRVLPRWSRTPCGNTLRRRTLWTPSR
ncbi:MAG: hypothetical protein FJY97_18340 [candidate division Zixibacteria bacterium]|nr:hypothetical protein [candidate division Zixibacteria bacterium]